MKYISLFSGIGGFELALSDHQCVFASEIDLHAQKTYKANFPNHKLHGDITKIPADEIPKHVLLVAGFPCQAFSIAGKGQGFKDPRGTLFWEILRIIDHHKTRILLLENVPRLLTHDGGASWNTIKHELESRGYTVNYKILNAAEFGVPQSRKRVFIIARRDKVNYTFPTPPNIPCCVADLLEPKVDAKYFLTKKALDGIKAHKSFKSCVKYMTPHRVATVDKGGQGNRVYSIKHTTPTLSALGGGKGAKTGLYAVESGIRRLTPRECARLQGFPEEFILVGSNAQLYKQFGNSVCVTVVKAIIDQLG